MSLRGVWAGALVAVVMACSAQSNSGNSGNSGAGGEGGSASELQSQCVSVCSRANCAGTMCASECGNIAAVPSRCYGAAGAMLSCINAQPSIQCNADGDGIETPTACRAQFNTFLQCVTASVDAGTSARNDAEASDVCGALCQAQGRANCSGFSMGSCVSQCQSAAGQVPSQCRPAYAEVQGCFVDETYQCQNNTAVPTSERCRSAVETFSACVSGGR